MKIKVIILILTISMLFSFSITVVSESNNHLDFQIFTAANMHFNESNCPNITISKIGLGLLPLPYKIEISPNESNPYLTIYLDMLGFHNGRLGRHKIFATHIIMYHCILAVGGTIGNPLPPYDESYILWIFGIGRIEYD